MSTQLSSHFPQFTVLLRPDFFSVATNPVLSNLSLMRLIVNLEGGGVLKSINHTLRTSSMFWVFQNSLHIHFLWSSVRLPFPAMLRKKIQAHFTLSAEHTTCCLKCGQAGRKWFLLSQLNVRWNCEKTLAWLIRAARVTIQFFNGCNY